MTALPRGFSRRKRSSVARTLPSGTSLRLIQIELSESIATSIDTRRWSSAVCASGRVTSTPGSLMKVAVTMKKISMMKTMSNSGVTLTSLSSAFATLRLLAMCAPILLSSLNGERRVDPGLPRLVENHHGHIDLGVRRCIQQNHAARLFGREGLDHRFDRARVDHADIVDHHEP